MHHGPHSSDLAAPSTQRRHLLHTLGALSALAMAPWWLSGCQSTTSEGEETTAPSAQAAPDPLAIDWEALNQAVGQYPHNAPFLEQTAITRRLTSLLGKPGYATAFANLQVSGPLSVEGSVFYIMGHRAHQGGVHAVAMAFDEASNRVRVWLLDNQQAHAFAEQDTTFAWPREVRVVMGESLQ